MKVSDITTYAASIAHTIETSRQMADAIAAKFGLSYDKSWHAEGNGGSFYFKLNGTKIRVSDHRAFHASNKAYWDIQCRPVNAGYFEGRGLPVPSCNFSVKRVAGRKNDKFAYKPLDRAYIAELAKRYPSKVVVRR